MQLAVHAFTRPASLLSSPLPTLINVPASPQSPGTAGRIVLVEEYGALAVAIGSALKKFAPGFATTTVRSLEEAEGAIAVAKPDLLVIDFDPPPQGALEFFTRLKSTAPATRVLVIAAAPLSRLADSAGAAGAFHFVEKPFDLNTLGAGVEAVLALNGQPTRRTLRDLALRDVIPLQCLAGVTEVVKVDASGGRAGEIHFIDGQISHAETTDTDGPEALLELLRWRSPRFKQPKRKPRAARTIEGNWSAVLLDAASKVTAEEHEPSSAAPAIPARQNIGGGDKIVVIDDTEMLLVFVEDILATANPMLEIFTAATGAEGVERVTAVKPRLILLDFSLPDFNGDEVCKRLLANPETAAIPVIMMSGHVPEMAASALRCENIVATVAKPFLSDALIDIVTKALADPAAFAVRSPGPVAPPTPAGPTASGTAKPIEKTPEIVALDPAEPPPPEAPSRSNGHQRSLAPAAESPPDVPSTSGAQSAPKPSASAALSPPPAPFAPPISPVAPPPLFSGAGGGQQVAIAPPPPISVIAPPPAAVQRPPASIIVPKAPPQQPKSSVAQPRVITAAAPARIASATTNSVVLGITLEVLAIQFSSTLQMAAIRARPASRTISLHVEAGALPNLNLPEAGFELGPVNLDARGQLDTVRLLPTTQRIGALPTSHAFPVGTVSVLPWNGGKAVELTPAAAAPMMMLLAAPFELAGVELSTGFGVGALVLKARSGRIRVSLDRDNARTGAAFQTAQVLLNRSAQIAEILLDAVA